MNIVKRCATTLKPQYYVSLNRLLSNSSISFESGGTSQVDGTKGSVPPKLETNIKQSQISDNKELASQQNEELSNYESDLKTKILETSLQFVSTHGWTKEAISAGAELLGYPGVIHGMFPKGGFDLIQHFYITSNKKLVEILVKQQTLKQDQPNDKSVAVSSTRDAIENAVRLRLEMIIPYIKHWPQALAIMSLPPNVPTSLANLLTLVDDIYYHTGDKTVDMNWYGRRIVLAGIYKSTELYMLQDVSVEYKNSWEFLHRRMDEASHLRSCFIASEQATHMAKEIATSAFITARNILGLSWNR